MSGYRVNHEISDLEGALKAIQHCQCLNSFYNIPPKWLLSQCLKILDKDFRSNQSPSGQKVPWDEWYGLKSYLFVNFCLPVLDTVLWSKEKNWILIPSAISSWSPFQSFPHMPWFLKPPGESYFSWYFTHLHITMGGIYTSPWVASSLQEH